MDSPPTRPVMRRGGGSEGGDGCCAPSLAQSTRSVRRCVRMARQPSARWLAPAATHAAPRSAAHRMPRSAEKALGKEGVRRVAVLFARGPQAPQAEGPVHAATCCRAAPRCCRGWRAAGVPRRRADTPEPPCALRALSPGLRTRRWLGALLYARCPASATHLHGGAAGAVVRHRHALHRRSRRAYSGAPRAEGRGSAGDARDAARYRQGDVGRRQCVWSARHASLGDRSLAPVALQAAWRCSGCWRRLHSPRAGVWACTSAASGCAR